MASDDLLSETVLPGGVAKNIRRCVELLVRKCQVVEDHKDRPASRSLGQNPTNAHHLRGFAEVEDDRDGNPPTVQQVVAGRGLRDGSAKGPVVAIVDCPQPALGYCEAAFALRNISVVHTLHTRANNLAL